MNFRDANKILFQHGVKLAWALQGKARGRIQVVRYAALGEPFQTYTIGIFEGDNLMNGFKDRTMSKPHATSGNKVVDGWYLDAHRPGFQNMTPPLLSETELTALDLALRD